MTPAKRGTTVPTLQLHPHFVTNDKWPSHLCSVHAREEDAGPGSSFTWLCGQVWVEVKASVYSDVRLQCPPEPPMLGKSLTSTY